MLGFHVNEIFTRSAVNRNAFAACNESSISSGGAGLQHCANWVIKSSKPTTSTPPLPVGSLLPELRTKLCSSTTAALCVVGAAKMIVQIASAEGFSRKCDVQIVGFQSRAHARFSSLDRRFAQALQFFFKRCAPVLILTCVSCALNHARFCLCVRWLMVNSSRSQSRDGLSCFATVICTQWFDRFAKGVERHNLAVDLRATATAMADVGMNVVGKINWRCALRQLDHFGVRREYVNTQV